MYPKDIGDNAFGKDDNISGDISGRKNAKENRACMPS